MPACKQVLPNVVDDNEEADISDADEAMWSTQMRRMVARPIPMRTMLQVKMMMQMQMMNAPIMEALIQ